MNKRQLRTIELLTKAKDECLRKDFMIWLNLLRGAQRRFAGVNKERQKAISRMTIEQAQKAVRDNHVEIARLHARTYQLKARLAELENKDLGRIVVAG